MRVLLSLLLLPMAFVTFGQNNLQTKKPSEKDSITLSTYRLKIMQTINANPDSALVYIKKFENFSAKGNYANSLADADYLYAQYFRRIQSTDSALFYFKKMIVKSTKTKYYRGLAMGYNGLCRTYYLIGEIDKAIQSCNKGLAYTKDFEDTGNIILADTHIALAIAYSRQNRMEDAISNLLVVDSIQKKNPLREDIIAAAYQSLGNVYLELKEYDSAEQYYLRANTEFEKIPSAGTFYFNTTNVFLGQVYYHKGQLEKADNLLTKTFAYFQQIKDERTTAEISNYLGLVNFEKGIPDKAEKYFQSAYNFQKKNAYNLEAGQSALQLGKLNIQKGNTAVAITYLKSALQFNNDIKNGILNQRAHSLLAEAYARQGNFKNAFLNSQIAKRINDSIQLAQSAENIKEIEGIYQTESRDTKITLLTTQNQLVEQQKKNQRNLLWGILTIIALVGIFVYFQFRNRQKTLKKLQELDATKSTFFANISHEFRTPLALIKGPIEDHLDSDSLSPHDRKNLNCALRNTQRLKDLVDQLLALAKLESGNLKLNIQQANMPNFIISQVEVFSFSCDEKIISFQVDVVKDNIQDWFDQDVLEKILYNLMGNAIKYTPENGFIKLTGKRQAEKFEISISNSGNYIPLDQQQKIFTRFYQTDSKNLGSGIGLALTKELTEAHKGTISVKSEENGTTEFKVVLPVKKTAFEENRFFSKNTEKENLEVLPVFEKFTEKEIVLPEDAPVILVIDDDNDIREYIKSIFKNTYTVHTATNGKEGFAMALETIPDIAVSDVMMPEEDGFTFTKHLKEHQLTSHIPVILLTAKSQVTSKLEGMGIGADAYVTKPFNSQLLKATAENLIENRRKLQKRFSQEIILMPRDISVSSVDEQFLERLQSVLDKNITSSDFSIENFGCQMGLSRMQLHRKLKALTGQSASEFLRSQRLKIAARILREKKVPISEVGYTVGFNDPSHFTKSFKKEFGQTPSDFSAN